jgi:hypothetical protein
MSKTCCRIIGKRTGFIYILIYTKMKVDIAYLCLFGEKAMFHSAYLPKTHNSASSLNTLYTA